MNVLAVILPSLAVFYLAYRFYGKYIEKLFDVDGSHVTPASQVNDGVDFVPTRKFVLFGHHFASIAGGGPIIGPTVALVFGYLPVWLWVVIGSVMIGAVHDFCALLASMRERGRSMAEIAEKTLGRSGFFLFVGFTIIMLLMVTSVFLTLTATALSSRYPLKLFQGDIGHIRTMVVNGVDYLVIGGIASTSVIVITLCAPLLGYLLYKRGVRTSIVSVLALVVCVISVSVGLRYPISINPTLWIVLLSFYTILAAGVPVWIVLQPRDFTNSFLLYAGMTGMMICLVIVGFTGAPMMAPAMNIAQGTEKLGAIWPILFITVACGAISGFHALVAGGTSSKQLQREKPDARVIGYGAMIVEGVLALCVALTLGVGLSFDHYTAIVFPSDPAVKANPILAFALGLGGLFHRAAGIPLVVGTVFGILLVEGFVVTTLDTAVRLNRYLFEELWRVVFRQVPKVFRSYLFNSLLSVVLMFLLAYFNAFKQLWQLFGSANQLLAALTMLVAGAWLMQRGKQHLFALIPGIFMFVPPLAALVIILVNDYIPKRNISLMIGDVVLIVLSLGGVALLAQMVRNRRLERQPREVRKVMAGR